MRVPAALQSDTQTALIHNLNSAAGEGDSERVKRLLSQLLHCRTPRATEQLESQVQAVEQLFYAMRDLAVSDELTGVYNRRGFESAANRMLRQLSRERRGALLLFADVDNLKHVNDTCGHIAGDRLLTAAAEVLREACDGSAVVGRIGGDEFALLARHSDAEDYNLLRQRITQAIAQANAGTPGPSLAMSMGMAEFDSFRPTSVLSMLERADRAMYAEKLGASARETGTARLALAVAGG